MSKTGEFGEPWGYYGSPLDKPWSANPKVTIGSLEHTEPIATFSDYLRDPVKNAKRAAACVNALDGMSIDALPGVVELLQYAYDCIQNNGVFEGFGDATQVQVQIGDNFTMRVEKALAALRPEVPPKGQPVNEQHASTEGSE